MNLGPLTVGPGHPCACVAELGNAHNGSLTLAIKLLDAAKEAGADAAKLQCYSPDDLVALRGDGPAPQPWGGQGWTMRRLYEKAQTPFDWFPHLYAHARSIRLPLFSSVFGPDGFRVLEDVGNPIYKLAALDAGEAALRVMVQATGKPVIRSIPVSAAGTSTPPGDWCRALFMACPPGYPQTRFHLGAIRNGFDGFSYHGTDTDIPVYAVLAGARMLECHFMLSDEPSELEAEVSLTQHQFAEMVRGVRRVEEILA